MLGVEHTLGQLRDASSDPWFDETSDETWFQCADTSAEEFVHTLELWLWMTGTLNEWALEYDGEGDPPCIPAKYVRLTRVTQWVLGDRSKHRSFDTTPISEWERFYREYCEWIDFEIEKQQVKDRGEPDIDDLAVSDESPVSGFEQSRIVGRATSLVKRALEAQIRDYASIVDDQRRGYCGRSYEFFNEIPLHADAIHPDFGIGTHPVELVANDAPELHATIEPDGPEDVYTWRWNGAVIECEKADRMKPFPWKLAKHLHGKGLNRRVRIADLVGFGCLFTTAITDASVAKHGSNATKWFRDNCVALKIATDDGYIWMESNAEA